MPDNPGANSLREVAKNAAKDTGFQVDLAACKDMSISWLCANAQPMQVLETIHQKTVRRAGQAQAAGSDARQQAEFESLRQFFAFEVSEPALRGGGDVADTSPAARFSAASKQLSAIRRQLSTSGLALAGDPTYLNLTRTRLLDSLLELDKIQSSFQNFPEYQHFHNADVPILKAAQDGLDASRAAVTAAGTKAQFEAACRQISSDVVSNLELAIDGLAKISMIYSIEPFFLFRLMVPFQAFTALGVTQADRRKVSARLTELLNNSKLGLDWMPVWLEDKIRELAQALHALDPNREDLVFFLKGGRAQAYLLGNPGSGTSDWDTGIVINPNLPGEYWHATFNKVHNLVLDKLRKFKQEFFVLVHLHANDIAIEMASTRSDFDEDVIEALDYSYQLSDRLCEAGDEKGSCKAELIDIGIPRRDTVEAFEQWDNTRPYVMTPLNDIPIPGHLYFVDEYLAMTREALAGLSPAPHKICKRVRRFFEILNIDNARDPGLDHIIAEVRHEIEGPVFAQSLPLVDQPAQPKHLTRLIPVLLKQFMHAYELRAESGLAPMVDHSFANQTNVIPGIAILPPVAAGIAADAGWNAATHGAVLQWVAAAAQVSDMFELNFRDRAAFFGFGPTADANQRQRRQNLESFVKTLYTQTAFGKDNEDSEVQLAVGGSLAAYLHADYGQLAPSDKNRLDPVTRIELKVFCRNAQADPVTVTQALLAPAIQAYLLNPANAQFNVVNAAPGEVHLFWPNHETIGHLSYRPLIVRIQVEREVWPQVAFIRGLPVLSLRDLIREYDRAAASAEEWGRVQRLRETSGTLRTLLTSFDY